MYYKTLVSPKIVQYHQIYINLDTIDLKLSKSIDNLQVDDTKTDKTNDTTFFHSIGAINKCTNDHRSGEIRGKITSSAKVVLWSPEHKRSMPD